MHQDQEIWPKWKNRSKLEKKTLQQGDRQPTKFRVQSTGNQDAHKNYLVWLQNEGRNEGYTKWNKGKYTGNQSEGKETGTQINDLEQREKINIHLEQNEETKIFLKKRETE